MNSTKGMNYNNDDQARGIDAPEICFPFIFSDILCTSSQSFAGILLGPYWQLVGLGEPGPDS